MSTIGSINVKVSAETGSFDKGMKRARDTVGATSKEVARGTSFFDKYRGAITAAASAAAAYAASAGIRKVIQNTIEQERATAQLEQTLRSTGRYTPELSKQMQEFAAQLQQVSTYGDEAILRSQALLLTFTQIGGDVFPKAQQAVLDVATAMQMDLKSASLQVGKALNDPILGVTALSRSGIQFTEDQKDVIKSLVDMGDVAGAQAIILKELETQFGGSAEAARNTLGGAIDSLKNAFGDLLEGSGGNVSDTTEAINRLTERLNSEEVKKGFDNIVSGALLVIEVLAEGTAALSKFGTKVAEVIYGSQDVETELEKRIKQTKSELILLQNQINKFGTAGIEGTFLTIFGDKGELEAKRLELAFLLAQQESDLAFYREKYKKDPVIGADAIIAPDVPAKVGEATTALSESFESLQQSLVDQIVALSGGEEAFARYQAMQKLGVNATAEEVAAIDVLLERLNALTLAKDAANNIEKIQERFKTEEQLQLEQYEREKALIEQTITDKAEQLAMLEQLQAEHNERMAEIQATTVPEGMQYTPEENEKFLEGLAERFASEGDLWAMKYENDLIRLQEARAQELLTEEEFQAAKDALAKDAAQKQVAIAEQEAQAKRNIMKGMMTNLSTLMNSGSKKMFQVGKAAAIANALISGYEAVVHSYNAGARIGGPPVGAAFAATAAAATAAQIGQIRKQSFGGGGSPVAYSGGLPATNTTTGGGMGAVNPNANSGGQRTISINLVGGGMFSAEQIRELIGKINEQTGDGVNLAVGG